MRFNNLILIFVMAVSPVAYSQSVSITMDDPNLFDEPVFQPKERNTKILEALRSHTIKAALFVCGHKIDSKGGRELLKSWNDEGHVIANHSYSHLNYNLPSTTYQIYSNDVAKVDPLISGYSHFQKLFRFPFLKEGNTRQKRDQMRTFLERKGYQMGFVTIDASDWYISDRMIQRLEANPKADLGPYRDFYLSHIWDRAQYYDGLSKKLFGKSVKHTLLVHHNLLNALFLSDLLNMFKKRGWNLIDAKEAFDDPVFSERPNISPAGESILWALAKESGKFDNQLRYPGEDGDYEKEKMDKFGL